MPETVSQQTLRESLHTCVTALRRRCASEIPEALIDRFVALDWLEWRAGGLQLTTTGENIYRQEVAHRRAIAERESAAAKPKG